MKREMPCVRIPGGIAVIAGIRSRRGLRLLGAAVIAAVLAWGQQPGGAPAAQTQTGSVEGTVTNSETGLPVAKAEVTLRSTVMPGAGSGSAAGGGVSGGMGMPSMPPATTASTDERGVFRFLGVAPGRYSVTVQRAGYVVATGAAMPGAITVSGGQTVKDIALRLAPQGVIAGKVLDEDGEPVANAMVRAWRWMYTAGARRLTMAGSASSNLAGVYMMGNLRAGEYLVSAENSPSMSMSGSLPAASSDGPEQGYVTTYYPGAKDPAQASTMKVAAGSQADGIDIRLRKTSVFRIQGRLQPPTSAPIFVMPGDARMMGGINRTAMPDAEGRFVVAKVAPGAYLLTVNSGVTTINGVTDTRRLVGRAMVTVADRDLTDVVLPVGPGGSIRGTVKVKPAADSKEQPKPPPMMSVMLSPVEGPNFNTPNGRSGTDGILEVRQIPPGRYTLTLGFAANNMYVASARFRGVEIGHNPLDIPDGTESTLDVVFSENAGALSGILRNEKGDAVPKTMVALWQPDEPERASLTTFRMLTTGEDGRFEAKGLAPGDYLLAAWDAEEPGVTSIAAFRNRFQKQAAKAAVRESSSEAVELKLIGRDAVNGELAKLQF
jgi:protocatechuate 3,4-dioxygenase beta subunit